MVSERGDPSPFGDPARLFSLPRRQRVRVASQVIVPERESRMLETTSLHPGEASDGVTVSPQQDAAAKGPIGRVFACVLTYNRKETAVICLRALLDQTWPVDRVVA